MKNMEEREVKLWKDMDIWKKDKLNSEKIWKIWKKSKLNGEKIWKIEKKSKLNGEKIWKLWKKSKLNMEIEPMRWQNPVSRAAAAAIHTYLRAAAAAIALKLHPKQVTNTNKAKHIMKTSHINVNIYYKIATSQQNRY